MSIAKILSKHLQMINLSWKKVHTQEQDHMKHHQLEVNSLASLSMIKAFKVIKASYRSTGHSHQMNLPRLSLFVIHVWLQIRHISFTLLLVSTETVHMKFRGGSKSSTFWDKLWVWDIQECMFLLFHQRRRLVILVRISLRLAASIWICSSSSLLGVPTCWNLRSFNFSWDLIWM